MHENAKENPVRSYLFHEINFFSFVLFFCLGSSVAWAENLVTNGDFSTGDLTGWATTETAPVTITHDGTEGNPSGSALLARNDSSLSANANYLYQVIPVTSGQQYKLDAEWKGDLLNGGTGRNWAEVFVSFAASPTATPSGIIYKKASDGGPNDQPMPWDWESVLLSPDNGASPEDGIFTATGDYMVIGFNLGGRAVSSNNTQPGFFWVDNVSVSPYPPNQVPIVTDLAVAGEELSVTGQDGPPNGAYQILHTSNLAANHADWSEIAIEAFDAEGGFAFSTDLTANPANFYRIGVLSRVSSPSITVQPFDIATTEGKSVTFSVSADGLEPLSYQWYFNSGILEGETGDTLSLSDVQLDDVGDYTVVVMNRFGEVTSEVASLSIIEDSGLVVDGYAAMNGGTTGGGNATPVTVTTAAEFKSLAENNTPAVIIVQGRLNVGSVNIGSNKTIIGADSQSGLYGGNGLSVDGSNYIFKNLTFGPAEGDVMEISGGTNVYITKCEFYDSTDELCSIVRQADYVTISWSKFYFKNPDGHSFAHLIGNSDGATADRGKLHVTLHHNWYSDGLRGRLPRVRFGFVHIYNNYYNAPDSGYCVGIGYECHIRLENTHFENVSKPWSDYGGVNNGELGWANLKFTNASQPTFMPNTYPTIFTPPYSYTLDDVEAVKSLVTAGAGNTW